MSRKIPIIKIHNCLLVSIQIELSDKLVSDLKDDICKEIYNSDYYGLIIELSGVDILDSYIARSIRDIIHIAALMGVKSWIVGLDPSMAITLVEMDMALGGISTALSLESVMAELDGLASKDAEDSLNNELDLINYLEETIR